MHRPAASEEPITVGAYLRDWLELQRHRLQPTTLRSYTGNVDRYLEPHLGDIPLHDLDILQLERCWARLMSEGGKDGASLSRRTVEYAAATLRSALSDGVRTGLLERNVAKLARLPTVDPDLDDTDDETIQVWTAAIGRPTPCSRSSKTSDYADLPTAITAADQPFRIRIGITPASA